MFDPQRELEGLGRRIGGQALALVLERSGIEVSTTGEADFEAVAAEWAELWSHLSGETEPVSRPFPHAVSVERDDGHWLAMPLSREYLLVVRTPPGVPAGRARFYASEWTALHGREFE